MIFLFLNVLIRMTSRGEHEILMDLKHRMEV